MNRNKTRKSFAGGGVSAASFVFYAGLGMAAAAAGYLTALFLSPRPEVPNFDLAAAERQASAQAPSLGKFIQAAQPETVPDLSFKSTDGKVHRLSEWRGKVVLLNLWATWCAPCKVEMPSLDRLQAKLGSDAFTVLTLSVDRGGIDKPAAFFAGNNITHLAVYNDSESEATSALRASGLPVSAVLDSEGREVARLVGPSEWDSPAATGKIEEFIKTYGRKG